MARPYVGFQGIAAWSAGGAEDGVMGNSQCRVDLPADPVSVNTVVRIQIC
jgi:hypothetical protein